MAATDPVVPPCDPDSDPIGIPHQVPNSDCDATDVSGWSASVYNKAASFVYSPAYTAPVLQILAAQPGERIIDFGCGTGELMLEIEKLVSRGENGMVVGVDFSENMVEKAKASGLEHVFLSDIQALQLPERFSGPDFKFDAVFSNASLHWCKRDPKGVLESVKRVLKKGGRFVGEMGGYMNCIGIRMALHCVLRRRGYDPIVLDPWYFPSVEDYRTLLTEASFEVLHLSLTPRLTPLPAGLFAWLNLFVRSSFLREFSDGEANEVLKEVEEMCRLDCQDRGGEWAMAYTRLRFCAVLR